MNERIFVFVVCGSREHIDALHFSLKCLEKFSKHKVWVLTDSSRNEISINHSSVIDIKTPKEFSHHQASIYLKTGIFQFVPKGNLYCYLDTDVIAVSKQVDSIFDNYISPILFAHDHCLLNDFSPFAINCTCIAEKELFFETNNIYYETLGREYNDIGETIEKENQNSRRNIFIYMAHWIRYHLSPKYYTLNKDLRLEKKSGRWLNKEGEFLDEKYSKRIFIEKKTGLVWDENTKDYKRKNGTTILSKGCTHLHEEIMKEFNISIPSTWQHWNGGVFLFDNDSEKFLEYWHKTTLSIFRNPRWKTRDQGSLVISAWKFGLQKHPMLNITYNFIVDYYKPKSEYMGDLTFKTKAKTYTPHFIHIFYRLGDKSWNVWQDIENRTGVKFQTN